MFDIAPSEFLLTAIIAIVVIGPKDMPLALRTAGRWIGKMRRMSNHLRSGFDAMIREAEMEEMERKWREQNEAIMAAHPPVPDPATSAHAHPVMLPLSAPTDQPLALPSAAPATIEQPVIAQPVIAQPVIAEADSDSASARPGDPPAQLYDGAQHVSAAPYPP